MRVFNNSACFSSRRVDGKGWETFEVHWMLKIGDGFHGLYGD